VLAFGWLPLRKRYRSCAPGNAELAVLRLLAGSTTSSRGRENIPAGSHVSMWKHSSTWKRWRRRVISAAGLGAEARILWIHRRWATWLMRPIAIDRAAGQRAVNQVVQQGRERLAEGLWVLVFPEGTRVPVGQTKKYGVSGALLAIAAAARSCRSRTMRDATGAGAGFSRNAARSES